MRRRGPPHPLTDLRALTRTGGGVECGECRRPILVDHVYFLCGDDLDGNHPFCWHCGVSIRLHFGQVTPDQAFELRQFGPP